MNTIGIFLKRLAQRVWFRAAVFTFMGVALALVSGIIAPWVPFSPSIDIGQDSVGSILQILATSMLAVTTFSLTAMVTAYSSAASIATPRATQLLVQDSTSQNVLSTFIGGFTYSLVGIIALSTGYYDEQGRTLLFIGTIIVVVIIIVTLLSWIGHLSGFGRMDDIIDRVEHAAEATLVAFARRPTLGARATSDAPPGARTAVHARAPGYVTHVDVPAIQATAERAGVDVFVASMPGTLTRPDHPLARATGSPDDETITALASAFTVDAHRTFEQDPRLGVISLSEIAGRALSPAMNDPGTAIVVLSALHRVFLASFAQKPDREVRYPHVWVTPVALADLLEDGFRPIARDGASSLEVGIRIQKMLASLATAAPANATTLRRAADEAFERARRALPPEDRGQLRATRRQAWAR